MEEERDVGQVLEEEAEGMEEMVKEFLKRKDERRGTIQKDKERSHVGIGQGEGEVKPAEDTRVCSRWRRKGEIAVKRKIPKMQRKVAETDFRQEKRGEDQIKGLK